MIVRDHPFLEMALGLRAACARVDALLDRYAPEADAHAADGLDDIVAIVLGVVAIRQRLGAAFASTPDAGHADAAARDPLATSESWLR